MRRLLLFIILCLPLMVMGQNKVAVYVTSSSDDVDEAAKQIIGTELVSAIIRNNHYDAVERTADFLDQIAAEQGYQHSGNVDDQQISALGKQFGVDYVCVANLVVFGGKKYYIQARLIDVETATVKNVARETASIDDIDDMILGSTKVACTLFNVKMENLAAAKTQSQPQSSSSNTSNTVNDYNGQSYGGTLSNTQSSYTSAGQPAYTQPSIRTGNLVTTSEKGVKVIKGVLKKVPESFDGEFIVGNEVTEIANKAFADCAFMSSVVIGNNVQKIGEDAFNSCHGLTTVLIPASVETIAGDAFHGCHNLQSVTILNPNLKLMEDVFAGCDNLRAIYVPAGSGNNFRKALPRDLKNIVVER